MSYSTRFSWLASIAMLVSLSAVSTTSAEAQFGRRLKDAVKRTAEDKAIQKATEEESKAIDSALSGGEAARPADSATAPGEGAAAAPAAGAANAATPPAGEKAAAAKPGEGVWVNYDFRPGERVLFADDFTKDEVGDFPRRLELKSGNMEVAEWQGGRFLRSTSDGSFEIALPETLPERFTLEFDYAASDWDSHVYFAPESESPTYVVIGYQGSHGGVAGGGTNSRSQTSKSYNKEVFPVRVMVDGSYAKVYMGDKRVGNAPNAKLGRTNKILFKVSATEDRPSFYGNIRVAAGGKKLYDALAEKGRVATQGIYFDTGSDRIRPESSGTLKEIGTMLKEHPELKLVIEGHTDNVGKPEGNQALSEKRAMAVRQYLVTTYQIEGTRLQAKGLGQTKPVTGNDTPEGRQNNRRVELVKS